MRAASLIVSEHLEGRERLLRYGKPIRKVKPLSPLVMLQVVGQTVASHR